MRSQALRLLLGSVLLGVLVGLLWAWLTPKPRGRVLADGTAVVPGSQVDRYIAGVGVFVLAAAGVGLVVWGLSWWGARSWRGPDGALLTLGAALLAGAAALGVGTATLAIVLPDVDELSPGQTFAVAPDIWLGASDPGVVSAPGLLLIVAPFVSTLCYLFAVLMSGSSDLGRTGEPDVEDGVVATARR